MVGFDPVQNFMQAQQQKQQASKTEPKKDTKTATPTVAPTSTNFGGFGYQIGSVGTAQSITAMTKKQKSQTVGRVIPKNPAEDKEILGASFDMLNGATSDEITKAYPTITAKLPALASYLSDAYDPRVDERKLYDAYPELSEDVKVNLRAQIKPEVEKQVAQQELETQGLTGKEKAKAFGLGTATGAGNVGYNLVGKWINKLGAKIGNEIKDSKAAQAIVKGLFKDVLGFSDEEIAQYQERQKLLKAIGKEFDAEENANLLREVGGRKLEQSGRGKAGKTVGEQAAITALTLPAGGIIAEGANALRGVVGLGKVGSIARGALAGGATGLVETEAQTIGTEGRLATGKELKTGATIGAVTGGLLAKRISPTTKAYEETILPKMTESVKAERGMQGLMRSNAFGKIMPVLSKNEKEMVEIGKKVLSPSKSNVTNLNKALTAAKSEGNKLKTVLSKNKTFSWATKDILTEMNKVDIPPLLKSDKTLANAYTLVKSQFKKILDKAPKTAEGLLNARQEFDDIVRKGIPNLYTNETLTPIKSAITSLRKIPNEILNSGIGDDLVKNSLRKQSLLLDIADNLSTKLEGVGTTKLGRTYRKYQDLLKAAAYLGGGGYGIYKAGEFVSQTGE